MKSVVGAFEVKMKEEKYRKLKWVRKSENKIEKK